MTGPVLSSAVARYIVSRGGGADRIPGGGINLNTYSYGKRDRQPRGGAQICPGGAEPPPPPPVATGLVLSRGADMGRGRHDWHSVELEGS